MKNGFFKQTALVTSLAAVLAAPIQPGFSIKIASAQSLSECQADPAIEGCADILAKAAEEEAAAKAAAEEAAAAKTAEEEAAAAKAAEEEAAAAKAAEEEAAAAKAAEEEAAAAKAAEEEAAAKAAEEEAAAKAAEEEAAAKAAEEEAAAAKAAEEEAAAAKAAEEEAAAKAAEEEAAAAKAAEEETPTQAGEADTSTASDAQAPAAEEPKTTETQEIASETEKPEDIAQPQPSADAPKPEPVAEAPIEEQIEKAAEVQTAVVPQTITAEEKQKLKEAEQRRREKARERRMELLGAAAAGAAIGMLVPQLGGTVVEDEGDRFVVERDGEYIVRRDESALLRDDAERVEIERLSRGRTLETVYRVDGSQVLTVRDAGGYVVRRAKITPAGREIVLFDVQEERREYVDYDRELPPIRLTLPEEEYIVPARRATRRSLAEIFAAPPVEPVTSGYTLREVRENERLRQIVRRVDLDTITFDSGSYFVSESEVPFLADIAGGMLDVIDEDPSAVFLVEGHTDAVGPDLYNLTLSDRRAETVARILSEAYGVPPENLVVEGYGERFLKIATQNDERRNRRVTIRNITPLLETAQR